MLHIEGAEGEEGEEDEEDEIAFKNAEPAASTAEKDEEKKLKTTKGSQP